MPTLSNSVVLYFKSAINTYCADICNANVYQEKAVKLIQVIAAFYMIFKDRLGTTDEDLSNLIVF